MRRPCDRMFLRAITGLAWDGLCGWRSSRACRCAHVARTSPACRTSPARRPRVARRPHAARRPRAACATSSLVRRLRPIVSAPSAARRLRVACAPPVRTAAACAPDAHPRVLAESSAFSLFQPGVHETGLCGSVFLTTCITRCVECDLKKKGGCILTRHFRRCYSSFTVLDGSRWG